MWCGIVTLFPEMFKALTDYGVTHRAVTQKLLQIQCWDLRQFATDRHRTVDDRPYGGGPGMVMCVAPLQKAIYAAKQAANGATKVIYVSPQGQKLNQQKCQEVAVSGTKLIFVAGRYEGIDERLITLEVDEEWSIGDYVLSGGELAIMVAIDTMARWIPGVLGHDESAALDSFSDGLLDYPHFTRPEVIAGLKVPEVLLSGDHAAIATWRLQQKLGRTWLRRKDLLENVKLNAKQQALLQAFISETEELRNE